MNIWINEKLNETRRHILVNVYFFSMKVNALVIHKEKLKTVPKGDKLTGIWCLWSSLEELYSWWTEGVASLLTESSRFFFLTGFIL